MKKIKKLALKKEIIVSLSQREQHIALGGVVGTEGCDTNNNCKTKLNNCILLTINATVCTNCYPEIAPIITNPPQITFNALCPTNVTTCRDN